MQYHLILDVTDNKLLVALMKMLPVDKWHTKTAKKINEIIGWRSIFRRCLVGGSRVSSIVLQTRSESAMKGYTWGASEDGRCGLTQDSRCQVSQWGIYTCPYLCSSWVSQHSKTAVEEVVDALAWVCMMQKYKTGFFWHHKMPDRLFQHHGCWNWKPLKANC